MIFFADTSFFCALYRTEVHSGKADAFSEAHPDQIVLSSLIGFEFRQSIRLQIRQHESDHRVGISRADAARVMRDFQADMQNGVFPLLTPDWPAVHVLAELLSAKHTETGGHRFADILHVATALQLAVGGFLTFDSTQRELAGAEGLEVPLAC